MRPLACILLLCLATPTFAQPEKIKVDFRGSKLDTDLVRLIGFEVDRFITPEPEGLRLRYTGAGAPPANNTAGVIWHFRARGDFKVTARYEILKVESAPKSSGVGVEVYLRMANKTNDGIAFARTVHPNAGPQFTFNYLSDGEGGTRRSKDPKRMAAGERSLKGQLQLERKGTVLIASKAEGDDAELQEIHRTESKEIGEGEVGMIRFAGLAGGDPTAILDFRLLEFSLEGENLGYKGKFREPRKAPAPVPIAGEPKAPEPPAAGEAQREHGPRWLFLIIAVMVAVPLLIAAVVIVVLLMLRKPKAAAKKAPAPAKAETSIKKAKS